MRPFYLILTTYADGEIGASDPRRTIDDAADEFAEVEKLDPVARQVLLIDPDHKHAGDVTSWIRLVISGRNDLRASVPRQTRRLTDVEMAEVTGEADAGDSARVLAALFYAALISAPLTIWILLAIWTAVTGVISPTGEP